MLEVKHENFCFGSQKADGHTHKSYPEVMEIIEILKMFDNQFEYRYLVTSADMQLQDLEGYIHG